MGNKMKLGNALIDEHGVKEKVEEVWALVFKSSNTVLKQAKDYGFLGIERIPSPNIHQILVYLLVFDALIYILLTHCEKAEVPYAEVRQLLNAKSQLVVMGRVASALKANNREDFETAISDLRTQAPF